ncbi:MAG: amidohydrolase, partial [Alphaproteobacteria bacterium]|nr:amidohydrolase [Alphaproteobacteria bacterium]
PGKPQVIALEEHYLDAEVKGHFEGLDALRSGKVVDQLEDVGQGRIADMDAAGIDIQVLSHAAPSVQKIDDAQLAIRLSRAVNDRLYETVRAHPDRYAGFAMLPTIDAKAAADELERCVTKLGFKGAMIHGMAHGLFIDDKRFWPIFERAEALDVPLYLHPSVPHPAVIDAYYKDYVEKYPSILRAAWGFTVETATQSIRLILSGVFDTYPGLKFIVGHLGEGLPFYLWRVNMGFARDGARAGTNWFRDAYCEHFWITTSGFFSDPALLCCMMEVGVDRILFSVDYPFVQNAPGPAWMERVPLCAEDRAKILSGNAKRLLKM